MTVLSEAVDGQDWSRSNAAGRFRGADDDGAARLLRAGGADLRMTATARSTRSSSRRSGRAAVAAPGTFGATAPWPASSATNCSIFRRILQFQRFLTALSVRPGRAWAMSAQRAPHRA